MSSTRLRALLTKLRTRDIGGVQEVLDRIASMVEPTATLLISAEAEGAHAPNTRRITIKVSDRIKQRWEGPWVARIWVTTAADGNPSSTGNTVGLVTGSIIATILAGAAWDLKTDATGTIVLDLAVSGAAIRYVYGTVGHGRPVNSGALAYA